MAGYSNGGMMAYSVGCTRGDMVAGVGVMSGAMSTMQAPVTRPIRAVIVFHGVGDYVLPTTAMNGMALGRVVNLWLDHNGIPAASRPPRRSMAATSCTTLTPAAMRARACPSTPSSRNSGRWRPCLVRVGMDGVSPSRILWEFFNEGCSAVSAVADTRSKAWRFTPIRLGTGCSRGLGEAPSRYTMMTVSGGGPQWSDRWQGHQGLGDVPSGVFVLQVGAHGFA